MIRRAASEAARRENAMRAAPADRRDARPV